MRREQTAGLKSFEDKTFVNITHNAVEVYSEVEEWIKIYTVPGSHILSKKKPKGLEISGSSNF